MHFSYHILSKVSATGSMQQLGMEISSAWLLFQSLALHNLISKGRAVVLVVVDRLTVLLSVCRAYKGRFYINS